jgi:hypothetical protein
MQFGAIFLLLSFVNLYPFISDDGAKEKYLAIIKKYSDAVSIDLTYNLNISSDGNPPNEIRNCRYLKAGMAYMSSIDDITIIGVPPYVLQLDAANKTIHIGEFVPLPSVFTAPGVQILLDRPELFSLVKETELIHRINIETEDFTLNRISIQFNPLSNEVLEYSTNHQEEIAYGESQIIKSTYRSIYTKQMYSSDSLSFSELNVSNYITRSKTGKILPADKYSTWSLFQLTKQ